MNIKPLSNRVVIKSIEKEYKSSSGIIIPDTAKEKPMLREIVAVGPGKLSKAGVIDPTKVTRIVLENAGSVTGLLLMTEAIIVDKPEKEMARMSHAPADLY
jgi:co-chaperonin GroES (HSP10)